MASELSDRANVLNQMVSNAIEKLPTHRIQEIHATWKTVSRGMGQAPSVYPEIKITMFEPAE